MSSLCTQLKRLEVRAGPLQAAPLMCECFYKRVNEVCVEGVVEEQQECPALALVVKATVAAFTTTPEGTVFRS